ncbi:MAG: porin family protein [Bacteroidales bacterium]|nr:porin family protein [Bacteroidales bacterium]
MKKLAHILLLALAMICASNATAQRIHGYVNAGMAGAEIEGDELKGMKHWGFTGGVGAIAQITDNGMFSLAIEADYSCRGVTNRQTVKENYYNILMDLHYVDIPLTFFYHDPYGGLNIGLGFVYGRLVSQPSGQIRYNPNFFVPDTTNMMFLKNDFSPAIEIRFDVWRGLQFSARYQYSLLKVKENWMFHDVANNKTWYNDCYNSSLLLRLIWQFGDDDTYTGHKKGKKSKRRY